MQLDALQMAHACIFTIRPHFEPKVPSSNLNLMQMPMNTEVQVCLRVWT